MSQQKREGNLRPIGMFIHIQPYWQFAIWFFFLGVLSTFGILNCSSFALQQTMRPRVCSWLWDFWIAQWRFGCLDGHVMWATQCHQPTVQELVQRTHWSFVPMAWQELEFDERVERYVNESTYQWPYLPFQPNILATRYCRNSPDPWNQGFQTNLIL